MEKKSIPIFVEETNINFYGWQIIIEGFFHSKRLKKYLPEGPIVQTAFIENDRGQSGIHGKTWTQSGEFIMTKLLKQAIPLKTLLKEHRELGENIWKIYQQIISADLSNVSSSQFVKWFKGLWPDYFELNGIGMVPVASDYYHNILSTQLHKILTNKGLKGTRLQNALNILMSPTLKGPVWQEQFDLLTIITKYKTLGKITASREFTLHVKKYQWLNYGYQGPQMSFSDFESRIKKIISHTEPFKKQLREHKNYHADVVRKQTKLEKQLKLTTTEKYLFEATRLFTYLKGYRIDVRHYFHFASDLLFTELGKRYQLPITWFRYAQKPEILKLLAGKSVPKKSILARKRKMLWVIDARGSRFIAPSRIRAFYQNYVQEEEISNTDIITGMPAFLGKVKGVVKIVNSVKDTSKVQHGDILVAITTNPDLLPAMYRANAFVTDSGGITSHAAIVARELKKPCIIGTKIGTKILKDGDLVEVDANKGVVKKLTA